MALEALPQPTALEPANLRLHFFEPTANKAFTLDLNATSHAIELTALVSGLSASRVVPDETQVTGMAQWESSLVQFLESEKYGRLLIKDLTHATSTTESRAKERQARALLQKAADAEAQVQRLKSELQADRLKFQQLKAKFNQDVDEKKRQKNALRGDINEELPHKGDPARQERKVEAAPQQAVAEAAAKQAAEVEAARKALATEQDQLRHQKEALAKRAEELKNLAGSLTNKEEHQRRHSQELRETQKVCFLFLPSLFPTNGNTI